MRFALINPAWTFEGSIYFGCREPHLPLEFGYAKALLEAAGHQTLLVDGQLDGLSQSEIVKQVQAFQPDFTVITTAPSYLFWRCAPPEIRVPQELANQLRGVGKLVVVGPHGSTTPRAVLKKLNADFVILGECEEVLPLLAGDPHALSSVAFPDGDQIVARGPNRAADMKQLPALQWPEATIQRHKHHHHRFAFNHPRIAPSRSLASARLQHPLCL